MRTGNILPFLEGIIILALLNHVCPAAAAANRNLEPGIPGYSMVEITWEIPIDPRYPNETTISVNGTIEQAIQRAMEINPNFLADLQFEKPTPPQHPHTPTPTPSVRHATTTPTTPQTAVTTAPPPADENLDEPTPVEPRSYRTSQTFKGPLKTGHWSSGADWTTESVGVNWSDGRPYHPDAAFVPMPELGLATDCLPLRYGWANSEVIFLGVYHLAKLDPWTESHTIPANGPGPGACGRVSCSWNSAIYWCNDNVVNFRLDSWSRIAEAAQYIGENCRHCYATPGGDDPFNFDCDENTAGQIFFKDNWSVIVRKDSC